MAPPRSGSAVSEMFRFFSRAPLRRLLSNWQASRVRDVTVRLAATFVLAVIVFALTLDFKILNPTHIDWCLSTDSDVTIYFFSFAYYRHAPWAFPITSISTLFQPVGSSLILMDGLPLVAVPLKVFERLLPARFQFLGLWLFLGIWLQGLCAERLFRALKLPSMWRCVGVILAVTAPPFIGRFGHVALSSHWVILLAMAAACSDSAGVWLWLAPTLALWIHPYLLAMVLPITLVGQLRLLRKPKAALRLAAMLGALLASLWVLGYFGMHETRGRGFYKFSGDLSSFFNGMGKARFLPGHDLGLDAWEGSAYLGCGGLLLAAVFVAGCLIPRVRRRSVQNYWLLAVCCLMAAYSFGVAPHYLGVELFSLDAVGDLIEPIATRFRASGRFIWPLFYYLLCFGLSTLKGLIDSVAWQLVSAPAVLAVQLIDIWPNLLDTSKRPELLAEGNVREVPEAIQKQLTPATRLILFMPPIKAPCGPAWRGRYQDLAWFGALHGLATNANLGEGRKSASDAAQVCRYTWNMFRHRKEHPEAIFIGR